MNHKLIDYHLYQLLDHLNNFIIIVSKELNVPPSEFEIMGGFARRLYMIKHDIKFHDDDLKGLYSSDVDIFCNVNNIIDEKYLEMLEDVAHERYDVLHDKLVPNIPMGEFTTAALFNKLQYNTDLLTNNEMEDRVKNSFFESAKTFIRIIDDIMKTEKDFYVIDEQTSISKYMTTTKMVPYEISAILRQLNGMDRNEYSDHLSLSSDNTFVVNNAIDPSFKVSPRNASITVPVTPKLQIVAANNTNEDTIKRFDFEQAKFKVSFPFSIEGVEKIGDVDDDNMYVIDNIEFKNYSPFRIVDRLIKYSGYGFTFTDTVKDDLDDHIDDFVDNNDIEKLPTYISSLY